MLEKPTSATSSAKSRGGAVLALRGLLVMTCGFFVGACESDPLYGGRPIGEWVERLSDSSVTLRIEAARALGSVLELNPRSARSAQALVGALADSVDAVRLAAAVSLANEGIEAPGIATGLAEMMNDSAHTIVRVRAADLLGLVKVEQSVAADALAAALDDPSAEVRVSAIQSLGRLGPLAQSAANKLVTRYDDTLAATRVLVLQALGRMQAANEETRVVYVLALKDSNRSVRFAAATAINALGPDATPLLPALKQALADSDPDVRHSAIVAIGQIGAEANTALVKLDEMARSDSSEFVRSAAEYTAAVLRGQRKPLRSPPEPSRVP